MKKIVSILLTIPFFFLSKLIKRKQKNYNPQEIRKILVIRKGAIGDVVMITPLLQEIRRCFPNANIDFLVERWAFDILVHNPNLHHIYILDDMTHPLQTLRAEQYDIVFLLELGIKNAVFARCLRPKILVGMDASYRGFLFDYKTTRFVGDGKHERYAFLETLQSLGLKVNMQEVVITLSKEEKDQATKFWQKHDLDNSSVIGVFPGGGVNPGTIMLIKRWGEDKYITLCQLLLDAGYKVMIFGGNSDQAIIQTIKEAVKNPNLIDVSKDYSLRFAAALIQRCLVFVSNDSGLMHMAQAVGTSTIGLFGPTDPKLVGPISDQHFVFFTKDTCSPYEGKKGTKSCHPCYRQIIGDFNRKCQTKECMQKIDAREVFSKIQELSSKTSKNNLALFQDHGKHIG